MKVINGFNRLKGKISASVVTFGIFDGLHKGHALILKKAVCRARRLKIKSVCITFWPSPKKSLLLYSLEHRLNLLEQFGLDICIVVNLSKHFSQLSIDDFVKNILLKRLNVREVVIGDNFRFGKKRSKKVEDLILYAEDYGFKVLAIKLAKYKHKNISSTRIRDYILKGELYQVKKMLGRKVSILGTVVHGRHIATAHLDLATANINPHHEVLPPDGVYQVSVNIEKKRLPGICYIGIRPTLNLKRRVVEVHILNFKKNLYGKELYIAFGKKIRNDRKFKNLLELKRQIKADLSKIS
ncbi:MAG: riboflavin biosynthesis protein RibF [Candidatus Gygaella obscura]|nr:riboflavin biosynthesis protein RibF [Candidatus Gygaella obscura]